MKLVWSSLLLGTFLLFSSQEKAMQQPIMPALERPMWMAPFFSHHSRYGDTSTSAHNGNAIWVPASEIERVKSYGMPLIVFPDAVIPEWAYNTIVAYWCSGSNINDLIDKVNQYAMLPEKPIIAYLDGRDWPNDNPFSRQVRDRVWPSIQAYRFAGENINSWDDIMARLIDKIEGYGLPMVLTSRFDDMNGTISIDEALKNMEYYEEWLRNYYFVGHMPFSDRRGNAISSNESLWRWARAFLYAIPSGRPNRFDYWRPAGSSIEDILTNKLGQSRSAVVLEPYLREDILSKYNESSQKWPNLLPTLEAVRLEHPTNIDVDDCVTILNKFAWIHRDLGVGLLRKEGGNHGTQRGTDIPCSVDWVIIKPQGKGTDCLLATPSSTEGPILGPAYPSWPNDGEAVDIGLWVEPVNPEI